MKEVLVRTKPKDSFTFFVSDVSDVSGYYELKARNSEIRHMEIVTLQFFQMSTLCNVYRLWLEQSVKLVLMYRIP